MKVVAVNSEADAWDAFVESAPDATSYHRFGWRGVISKTFGHQCHYLAAVNDQGEWHGVLPHVHMRSKVFGNFMVSIPFVNYGGLICANDVAAQCLLDEAEQLRHSVGATHVELRHLGRELEGMSTKQHKVTMILELAADPDSQWRAFNAKLRNQIRKAEKSGLQSVIGHL